MLILFWFWCSVAVAAVLIALFGAVELVRAVKAYRRYIVLEPLFEWYILEGFKQKHGIRRKDCK